MGFINNMKDIDIGKACRASLQFDKLKENFGEHVTYVTIDGDGKKNLRTGILGNVMDFVSIEIDGVIYPLYAKENCDILAEITRHEDSVPLFRLVSPANLISEKIKSELNRARTYSKDEVDYGKNKAQVFHGVKRDIFIENYGYMPFGNWITPTTDMLEGANLYFNDLYSKLLENDIDPNDISNSLFYKKLRERKSRPSIKEEIRKLREVRKAVLKGDIVEYKSFEETGEEAKELSKLVSRAYRAKEHFVTVADFSNEIRVFAPIYMSSRIK